MQPRIIRTGRMREVPVGWRMAIRDLSLGPVAWGAWSWTFHDGSCWAALGFTPDERLIGWALLTCETDLLPVVAAYVHPTHRGHGLATELLTVLLRGLIQAGDLHEGDRVFASLHRWKKYETVLGDLGLEAVQWV